MVSCWAASSVQLPQLWVSLHLAAVAAAAAGAAAVVPEGSASDTATGWTAGDCIAEAMHANACIIIRTDAHV